MSFVFMMESRGEARGDDGVCYIGVSGDGN